MTNKLKLSDFLAGYDDKKEPATPIIRKEESEDLTFPLSEFCSILSQYQGTFLIEDRLFSSMLPSTNSLYFFNEHNQDEYMIIFDPIIDIKQRDSAFVVFYYPNQVINIALKESNVQENKISKDFES